MSTKGNLLCHISSFNRYHSRKKIVEQHFFGDLLCMALGQHIVFTDVSPSSAQESYRQLSALTMICYQSSLDRSSFLAVCAALLTRHAARRLLTYRFYYREYFSGVVCTLPKSSKLFSDQTKYCLSRSIIRDTKYRGAGFLVHVCM